MSAGKFGGPPTEITFQGSGKLSFFKDAKEFFQARYTTGHENLNGHVVFNAITIGWSLFQS